MQHWEIVNQGKNIIQNNAVDLWNNACSYFKLCDENPIITKRTITQGKGSGTRADVEQPRAYSIKALCLHCNITEEYIRDVRDSKNKQDEYYVVITKILYIIYTNNLEQAMVGNFSPVITTKLLNLEREDKSEGGSITVNVISTGIPELSNSENEILEKLELELSLSENSKGKNTDRENELDSDMLVIE